MAARRRSLPSVCPGGLACTHADHFLESPPSLDEPGCWLLSSTHMVRRQLCRSVIHAHRYYPERPRSLGEKLRRMRLDLRLQIKEVAAAVGVCETTVINWERRRVIPKPERSQRIRDFYQSKGHSLTSPSSMAHPHR
jgi:DNA-binding XRE family transcriptional regulator